MSAGSDGTDGEWAIGVDFGTGFSKAAASCVRGPRGMGQRELLPLHIGAAAKGRRSLIVPSAMFLDQEMIHFGPRAPERLHAAANDKREMLQSFKTILGANDFENVLDMSPPRPVDPSGSFKWGDLIVLYLAYLLELIDRAAPEQVGALYDPKSAVRLRYSRPGWIPKRAAAAHEAMGVLFGRAAGVRAQIGPQLLAAEGLTFQGARDALGQASAFAGATPNLDGGVYEASAVAACHFVDPATPNHLVIVDIGAGTADFAGFIREPGSGAIRVVPEARRTINVAGDTFDRALMMFMLAKAKTLSTTAEQSAFWRALLANVRDLKETMFTQGQAQFQFRNTMVGVRAGEFQSSPAFRAAAKDLEYVYRRSLTEMARVVRGERGRRIGVVLAGGGAHLPSTIAMVKKTRKIGWSINVELLPTSPRWASDLSSEKEFAALFSQMCVAFGTAIAGPREFQGQTK
jgi:molecular chaperone DnaK (HSP70)